MLLSRLQTKSANKNVVAELTSKITSREISTDNTTVDNSADAIVDTSDATVNELHVEKVQRADMSNDDILALTEHVQAETTTFESKLLESDNLKLKPKECARFILSTDNTNTIKGFNYCIQCEQNFICTSNLEKLEGNNVSLVVNNLSNKDVKFNIMYIATF